jgi:hypothetical protein
MPPKVEAASLSPFELFANQPHVKASIEPAPLQSILMTKPTLSANPMLRYLRINTNANQIAEEIMEYNMHEVEEHRSTLEVLRSRQIEKLQNTLKAQDFNGFWSILAKVGSIILGALSTIMGFVLLSSGAGTIVGGAMIAAGVLSLTNSALEESGGWDFIAEKLSNENDELRRKLRFLLPAAIGVICGIIGIGGTIAGWGALNLASKAFTIIQTAANFAAAITMGSKGIHDAQIAWTEAELEDIKHQLLESKELLDELVNRFMISQKQIQRELNNASRIIALQFR